jgi:hypothetical protein
MQHVEKVFASMDRNRDGMVTVEERIMIDSHDNFIKQSYC